MMAVSIRTDELGVERPIIFEEVLMILLSLFLSKNQFLCFSNIERKMKIKQQSWFLKIMWHWRLSNDDENTALIYRKKLPLQYIDIEILIQILIIFLFFTGFFNQINAALVSINILFFFFFLQIHICICL